MKYQGREIKDFEDAQLLASYKYLDGLEKKRLEAASHEKFKKMEFPPANPEFVQIKNEMYKEITTRKLEI
jgi:hypothetical protein